jgi:excisionase family DNA binding protein
VSEAPVTLAVVAPTLRLALTPTEAADALGVSVDYFAEHVARELRWVRRGRKRLVPVREIEAWLDRSAVLDLGGGPSR